MLIAACLPTLAPLFSRLVEGVRRGSNKTKVSAATSGLDSLMSPQKKGFARMKASSGSWPDPEAHALGLIQKPVQ